MWSIACLFTALCQSNLSTATQNTQLKPCESAPHPPMSRMVGSRRHSSCCQLTSLVYTMGTCLCRGRDGGGERVCSACLLFLCSSQSTGLEMHTCCATHAALTDSGGPSLTGRQQQHSTGRPATPADCTPTPSHLAAATPSASCASSIACSNASTLPMLK